VARGGFDVRDVMATAGLLRGLVTSMVAVGAGHVHICAAAGDVHTRYALTALADALSEQLHGSGVEFHTNFAGTQAEATPATAQPPEPAPRGALAPAR
jgi:hypothetical protein